MRLLVHAGNDGVEMGEQGVRGEGPGSGRDLREDEAIYPTRDVEGYLNVTSTCTVLCTRRGETMVNAMINHGEVQ